jgi:hypothetical protein
MTATDQKNLRKHVRKLRTIALGRGNEDRRLDAVKSLAAIYLLQAHPDTEEGD